MQAIRITAELVQFGNVQFIRGRTLRVSEKLAESLIASGEAETVSTLEFSTMPRTSQNAIVPRPSGKPKPPAKAKGR